MNLHAIPDGQKLFLLTATDDDNHALTWFVTAPNHAEARRAFDILARIADNDGVYRPDITELDPTWFHTADETIAELKADYDWVFEDDE